MIDKPKPRLILAEERHPQPGLAGTTWEQRQGYRDRNGARVPERVGMGMSAEELVKAMGEKHVGHPDYKGRDYTLNPEPNLSGVQPCISYHDARLRSVWKQLLYWAMR